MGSRAERRAAKDRMKAKAKRLYPLCANPIKYADNLTVCSCLGCGNPRRHFGEPSIQERRAAGEK